MALLGVGSIVSLGVLIWFLKKGRRDIERHADTEAALRLAAKEASDAREKAEEREYRSSINLKLALDKISGLEAPYERQLDALRAENLRFERKFELLREISKGDGAEFWSLQASSTSIPDHYTAALRSSIPILLFANQKGGVGKTTLSTNIAAYFSCRGEKVLLVDLDYQGSATGLLLAQARQRPQEFPSMVDMLFATELDQSWHKTSIQAAANNLDYISCWYSFEKLERHLEYAWVLGDSTDDVRYRLARALLSRQIQTTYHRVIIDAPPRMTTGFINGFCAATHLFVPTVVDSVSAGAVGTFASRFNTLSKTANTVVNFSGVIGTMTPRRILAGQALGVVGTINANVRKALGIQADYFMREAVMARSAVIGSAATDGIAYLCAGSDVRAMFDAIGQSIAERAPLRRAPDERTTVGSRS
ncbi:MAG: ParA family protein [Hyphomicrobiaceae bacterium]